MLVRFPAPTVLLLAFTALAGCGGGGKSTSTAFACTGEGAKALCLNACSLGCTTTGCSLSDIAQNEIIYLYFSQALDRSSVSSSTIQLRTSTGELPVGEFFVVDNRVEFVPTLLISGSQSFFGFRASETYTLTIPGVNDAPVVLKGASGQPFKETFTCSLVASQGIRDHNGVPPSATLLSPTPAQLGAVPLSTQIVLEFNEMVDATPFLAAGGGSGPVTFTVRRTRPAAGGGRECDSGSTPVVLPGSPRLDFDPASGRSVLTFRSTSALPANACIEVNVTSVVTDISGRPAQPQVFAFLTEAVPLVERDITEEFDDDLKLDRDVSAGTWSGGVASFLAIGGDGRHGTFSTDLCQSLGVVNGKRTFVLNANSTIIPAENTRFGIATAVTDGRFFFDKMVIPSDVRLRISGTVPAMITVAGRFDILGEIDVAGETLTTLPINTQNNGQTGGIGGPYGGNGGAGGDRCLGIGASTAMNGRTGQAARVLGGHAYAGVAAGTGGTGSTLFPANGLATSVLFGASSSVCYTPMSSAGGGGGGLLNAGIQGRVVSNNHNEPTSSPPAPPRLDMMGPPAPGGAAMQFFPIPSGARSSEHFLVGGSGGGGSASSAVLSVAVIGSLLPTFAPGAGGGGGGGAVALRAGYSMLLGPTGRLVATGGGTASPPVTAASSPQTVPGGGGSGGSIVLQAGRGTGSGSPGIELQGAIDVRGGTAGVMNRPASNGFPPTGATVRVDGGNGAAGFVRCEFPGTPTTAVFTNIQPAATADNVGSLTETDNLVGFQSTWYSTNQPFGPEYARYEIRARLDGSPTVTVFSDDPAVSTLKAENGQALRAYFQNANLDPFTGLPAPLVGETTPTIRPWRTQVLSSGPVTGIASDGLNGFRFALVIDRSVVTSAVIESVKVFYRI